MGEYERDEREIPQGETHSGDLAAELHELGQNLREILHTAWESAERKKIQQEIEAGLRDLGATLNQAINEFAQSPTGQTIKNEVEELHERIKTGEVETQIRQELFDALHAVNNELKKVFSKQPPSPPGENG